jgi:hypothetical protein
VWVGERQGVYPPIHPLQKTVASTTSTTSARGRMSASVGDGFFLRSGPAFRAAFGRGAQVVAAGGTEAVLWKSAWEEAGEARKLLEDLYAAKGDRRG